MQQAPADRFDELYRTHVGAVRAYVRRRAPTDAVEDAVAETFAVCWRRLADVPRDPLPWLYAVARKTLANQRRSEARQTHRVAAEPPPAEAPEITDDPKLGIAFAALSEADREVLRLVAWEQLAPASAARVLGCSAVACRVRLHRAKRRLAAQLDELEAGRSAASHPRPDTEGAIR